ncbi:MAG: cardiolipin synthase ClsB [Elusimicrobia bacterium]|nr:cardiolipin synthase ClsB [Elusimicrobiota bacterium]
MNIRKSVFPFRRLSELLWRAIPETGYCEAPAEFSSGNRLTLLVDGKEAYPSMLEAIASARRSVNLETYILRSDRTGRRFAEALTEKARAGAAVRVIYDSIGSFDLAADYVSFLRNAGVQLLEYRPLAPWQRRWGWSRRDHRKILVVDGTTAFTGGINITDDYADPSEGGGGWHDAHVRIEGPAAYELERLFRSVWYRETGRWFQSEADFKRAPGKSLVRVVANEEFLHRHRIRSAYLHAIHKAKRCVYIANAYFVPDSGIRRALYRALRRGVDVRVLVPSISDVPAAAYASRYLFESHLRRGLRLFAWPGPMLHAKIAVVDGVWSVVGSYNMDSRSWWHNLEANIHVVEREFSARLEVLVVRDMERSREITLPRWRLRPPSERLFEGVFHLLRYWL